jgi:Sulfatase
MLRRRSLEADPQPPVASAEGVVGRHLVMVVLDSLRYDSWVEASPTQLGRLGKVDRRWSYASWTAPSHYNLLIGLLPHTSPTGVYASECYKSDLARYADRLGVEGVEFKSLLPSLFLPSFLKHGLGYQTHAMVSMPVLNRHTPINRDFDTYELMPKHNDMAAMLDRLKFDSGRPSFHLLNTGETHYPYALPDEEPGEWPHIPGVHGVVRQFGEGDHQHADEEAAPFFNEQELASLRSRQVQAVDYLDGVFARLFDIVPRDTWIVVTSDHGGLFGEGGYFGHGPISHEKVLEVPFVEGMVP